MNNAKSKSPVITKEVANLKTSLEDIRITLNRKIKELKEVKAKVEVDTRTKRSIEDLNKIRYTMGY